MQEESDEYTSNSPVASREFSPALTQSSAAPSFSTNAPSRGRRNTRSPSVATSIAGSDVSHATTITGRKRRGFKSVLKQLEKNPTIYDVAAGKIRQPSRHASYVSKAITKPYSPVEYYFDRKRVKTGDEDEDSRLYWQRDVDKHELPPSDLLWAIHRHASHFFEEKGEDHLKFMDETALLAIGILLEETMKQSLGDSGHLAFLEPDEQDSVRDDVDESDEEADQDDANVSDEGADEDDEAVADGSGTSELHVKVNRQPNNTTQRRRIPVGYTQDDYLTD